MNSDQIEEWVREVEQRPSSAPLIIQYIARRLSDLSRRNEELLAENIELRSGRKVEEFESKIANLEYQLDLLRRQFTGQELLQSVNGAAEQVSIVVFDTLGRVLRLEIPVDTLGSGAVSSGATGAAIIARIAGESGMNSLPPRLLVTSQHEELMFAFDSGRVVKMPVSAISVVSMDRVSWENASVVEPRSGEELAAVVPIGKMTLYDFCTQISRRGCAKRMMKASFETHLANHFIGSGVKLKNDKTCCLVFSGKDDQLVLASKEGFLLTSDVSELSYTTEEMMRLSATDHIITGFVTGTKPSVIFVTQNGKVIHREVSWLTKAESARSRGQAVYSQARRDAGVRIVGAAAVDEEDWVMAICADGSICCNRAADLFTSGTIDSGDAQGELIAFTTFRVS